MMVLTSSLMGTEQTCIRTQTVQLLKLLANILVLCAEGWWAGSLVRFSFPPSPSVTRTVYLLSSGQMELVYRESPLSW